MKKSQAQMDFEKRLIEKEIHLRREIRDQLDAVLMAYLQAGGKKADYVGIQYFLFLLVQSVSGMETLSRERIGGLLVILRFLKALTDQYLEGKVEPEEYRVKPIR